MNNRKDLIVAIISHVMIIILCVIQIILFSESMFNISMIILSVIVITYSIYKIRIIK